MGSTTGVMLSLGRRFQLAFFVALVVATHTFHAFAAEPKWLGAYKKWSAFVFKEGKTKICYIHSEPEKMVGKYKKRGAVFFQVTHRPNDKVKNEVALTAGYTYKSNSDVEVEIDGKRFTLFTDKDGAWARDSKTDAALIKAMKRGKGLIVRGTSKFGTATIDTYSLSGFSAAHRAINKECKV